MLIPQVRGDRLDVEFKRLAVVAVSHALDRIGDLGRTQRSFGDIRLSAREHDLPNRLWLIGDGSHYHPVGVACEHLGAWSDLDPLEVCGVGEGVCLAVVEHNCEPALLDGVDDTVDLVRSPANQGTDNE